VERGAWLPFVRYTDKIDDFKMSVTTPSRYKTMGVGAKISETENGDRTTTVWAGKGVHFPTIIFGVYFEDTPKSTAEKMDGTKIPVTIHCDKDNMRDWQIPPKNLRPLAEQAINALNIYRELYGVDYPHGKLDLVNQPGFVGAQAPDSIVYVTSGVFRGEAFIAEVSGSAAGMLAERIDTLVAHEVGHQWWGGVVGNRNMRHYWFVEALAEYSSALYMEIVDSEGYKKPEKGRKAYMKQVERWRKQTLETDLMNSVQNCRMGWLGENSQSAYLAMVYAKGPYAFHILRETFGDEKMFAFLKNLMTELAGKNIVTRDIQRVAEQSFGGTMEWFFDQWIRGIGIPQYSFNYGYRKAEDGTYIVEGNVKQRVVAGLKKHVLDDVYYRGIVPVTVVGKDRQEYRKGLLVEGADTKFALKVPVEPMEITFNAEGEILAHPTLDNLDF
jgi:aminopeptidase N